MLNTIANANQRESVMSALRWIGMEIPHYHYHRLRDFATILRGELH